MTKWNQAYLMDFGRCPCVGGAISYHFNGCIVVPRPLFHVAHLFIFSNNTPNPL